MEYELRPATEADFEFLYRLHVASMREHVEPVWGWDESDQLACFRAGFRSDACRILVVGGEDIGAISVVDRGTEVWLRSIEILPEHQGKGLGTQVLRDLLEDAAVRGRGVSLQVLKGNRAGRLYERLGFQVVGDTETHLLLRRQVPDWTGAEALKLWNSVQLPNFVYREWMPVGYATQLLEPSSEDNGCDSSA